MIVESLKVLLSVEVLTGDEWPFAGNLKSVFADVSGYSALESVRGGERKSTILQNACFLSARGGQCTCNLDPKNWRIKMLAIQIAAEINQRWSELEKLESLDRLHVLETLIERNVLATGPCCSSNYVPSYENTSDFDRRPTVDEADRH